MRPSSGSALCQMVFDFANMYSCFSDLWSQSLHTCMLYVGSISAQFVESDPPSISSYRAFKNPLLVFSGPDEFKPHLDKLLLWDITPEHWRPEREGEHSSAPNIKLEVRSLSVVLSVHLPLLTCPTPWRRARKPQTASTYLPPPHPPIKLEAEN